MYAQDSAGASRWSTRILVLSIAGIFFLTLYPFHFARRDSVPDYPLAEDQDVTSTGLYSATMSFSDSADYVGFLVAFKAAAARGRSLSVNGVSVSPSATTAVVSWTTKASASSRVDYGTSTAYGSNVSDPTLVTSHSLTLNSLTCNTTYHYQITSLASGNSAPAIDGTFTTGACRGSGGIPAYVTGNLNGCTATSCGVSLRRTNAGDLIVLGLFAVNSTNVGSVSDTQGNHYALIGAPQTWSPNNFVERLYYAKNIKGGVDTVTVTLSGSTHMVVHLYEYSGLDTSSPLDASATPHTGNSVTGASGVLTTTNGNDLLFGFFHSDNDVTNTAGSGFTGRTFIARTAFLLGNSGKAGPVDAFLNVLLFIPYGLGLAAQINARRRALATVAIAFATGALLSYVIEFLQLYVPQRDSGWNDVITNSIGALIGAVVFQVCGLAVLRFLRNVETGVEAFATKRNAAIASLLYFAVWFAASAHFQRAARLANWSSNAILLVGNSSPVRLSPRWKGEVYQLEFWDRALSGRFSQQLTALGNMRSPNPIALAAYDFSGSPPFADQDHHLPALDWVSIDTDAADPLPVEWNGATWASTPAPVSALIDQILKARQFSVRLRCAPSQIAGISAAIVSISQPAGASDLEIRQEGNSVAFSFRTPITASRPLLTWSRAKIFAAQKIRDLLFSYDGSHLSVAIDGRQIDTAYGLGPGPALARFVRTIKSAELEGYRYIFYSLVFFPVGALLAIGWREHPRRARSHLPIALAAFALAPILLEILLTHIGGQSISLENIGLGFAAMCSAAIWINLGAARATPQTTSPGSLS